MIHLTRAGHLIGRGVEEEMKRLCVLRTRFCVCSGSPRSPSPNTPVSPWWEHHVNAVLDTVLGGNPGHQDSCFTSLCSPLFPPSVSSYCRKKKKCVDKKVRLCFVVVRITHTKIQLNQMSAKNVSKQLHYFGRMWAEIFQKDLGDFQSPNVRGRKTAQRNRKIGISMFLLFRDSKYPVWKEMADFHSRAL